MVWIVLLLITWAAYSALMCWLFPFTRCWGCNGSGRKYQSETKKTWREHRRCKGSGRRLRFGRWVWNFMYRRRSEGSS